MSPVAFSNRDQSPPGSPTPISARVSLVAASAGEDASPAAHVTPPRPSTPAASMRPRRVRVAVIPRLPCRRATPARRLAPAASSIGRPFALVKRAGRSPVRLCRLREPRPEAPRILGRSARSRSREREDGPARGLELAAKVRRHRDRGGIVAVHADRVDVHREPRPPTLMIVPVSSTARTRSAASAGSCSTAPGSFRDSRLPCRRKRGRRKSRARHPEAQRPRPPARSPSRASP